MRKGTPLGLRLLLRLRLHRSLPILPVKSAREFLTEVQEGKEHTHSSQSRQEVKMRRGTPLGLRLLLRLRLHRSLPILPVKNAREFLTEVQEGKEHKHSS
jgi:hypothetical protein